MTFENLSFQASWRQYQQRVLDDLESHLDDHHLHIVAAPGSGKTILGLEVMRRIGKPTLILAPTVTIRNQWVDRLTSMFLTDKKATLDWVSKDIRQPKLLTVITYQALHAAFSGTDVAEEQALIPEDDFEENITTPTTSHKTKKSEITEILSHLNQQKIQTLILDEAHHLRKEWWKALTKLKAGLKNPNLVSLTATPPYDVDQKEWQRYEQLCGPIDAEISVPELVKCGDLCPHQDYVYFSLPTKLETQKLQQFKGNIAQFLQEVQTNQSFLKLFSDHPWINDTENHIADILSEPKFFSAMIIFLNSVQIETPQYALNILGVTGKDIPQLTPDWLETLLTGIFYTHNHYFKNHDEVLKPLRKQLQRIGAIYRRKVRIDNTKEIQKLLASSLGKLDSIVEITRAEANHLGDNLRQLILADYIRKTELPANAQDLRPINKIGVIPIFEYLRRANIPTIKLGVLTGSLVFIPKDAQPLLLQVAAQMQLSEQDLRLGNIPHDQSYISVEIKGAHKHKIVQLITEIFNAGGITVLIGTQALLGEGWDAPSINTLILASYVGSYMLSNQMRGRAIRTNPLRPNKVANIWHLVAVDLETLEEKLGYYVTGQSDRQKYFSPFDEIKEDLGNDVHILRRRFRAFEGISYHSPIIIENGFKRLGLSTVKWDEAGVQHLNDTMLKRATDREALPKQWQSALEGSSPLPEMREKVETNYAPKGFAYLDTLKHIAFTGLLCGAAGGSQVLRGIGNGQHLFNLLTVGFGLAAICALPKLLKALHLLLRNGSLENSMKQVGWAVLETLQQMELIKTNSRNLRLQTFKDSIGVVYCRLDGATAVERKYFLDAMQEILGPSENPRYLLVRYSSLGAFKRVDYHPVPTLIGQYKSNAEFFAKRWNRYVGTSELVYTRSTEGRMTLLQARTQSLAAAFQKKTDRISIWE